MNTPAVTIEADSCNHLPCYLQPGEGALFCWKGAAAMRLVWVQV